MDMLELSPELKRSLPAGTTFDDILDWPGEEFRRIKNRRTVRFEAGGRAYFLKVHRATGWAEILKNVSHGRLPTVTAEPEWKAVERLDEVGVRTVTVAGRGLRGRNPARRESFIITEALEGMVELHDLTRDWRGLEGERRVDLKRALLKAVAECARKCHKNGVNHRDFYLAHFLVEDRDWQAWRSTEPLELYLIDLHRAQSRARVPRRWLVKDLGALLFSALNCGLTSTDLLRFVAHYRSCAPAKTLRAESGFWRDVCRRAVKVYRKEYRRPPQVPRLIRNVLDCSRIS